MAHFLYSTQRRGRSKMAQDQFSRATMIIGKKGIQNLKDAHVAVFGLGGVGGYAVEGLVRSGIGELSVFDDDNVCITNVNRQVIATIRTVGEDKVDLIKNRIKLINPRCKVNAQKMFFGRENKADIDFTQFDYIIDAVDTITAKLLLIEEAKKAGVPVISCMGTGNKLDPTQLKIADISKTSICPLARVMRKELKRRKIRDVKVVFSTEPPIKPDDFDGEFDCNHNCVCPPNAARHCVIRNETPGSVAFVPSVAGMYLCAEVVRDIIGKGQEESIKEAM